MNRGLRPVLDAIDLDGCPYCGEHPIGVDLRGPDDIRLSCGHIVNAKAWADNQFVD